MTKQELAAENKRLGAEIAALRELLTVIAGARPPLPVSGHDMYRYYTTGSDRLLHAATIAAAVVKRIGDPAFSAIAHGQSAALREYLGQPLRYEAEAAEPAPVITDSGRTCDQANPVSRAWCHKSGPHDEHRDTDGETWTTESEPAPGCDCMVDADLPDCWVPLAENSCGDGVDENGEGIACGLPAGHKRRHEREALPGMGGGTAFWRNLADPETGDQPQPASVAA